MALVAPSLEQSSSKFPQATDVIKSADSKELFFAVVGHVGAGNSMIAITLKTELEKHGYDVVVIKASQQIRDWATSNALTVPVSTGRSMIENTIAYQNFGDKMREQTADFAAVAQGIIAAVRVNRAEKTGVVVSEGHPVEPDGNKRAYIFDSIRHPAEVFLLREVYNNSFTLIGVVCQEHVRVQRLLEKYFERRDQDKSESKNKIEELMKRDSDDKSKDYGQHVADAFYESDYFVDNTIDSKNKANFNINETLGRLIDILTHSKIIRPTIAETAMHYAMTSQLRSSCLSRQVGAALVDVDGDVIATGTNEAPSAGGGVYGKSIDITNNQYDHRCFNLDGCTCSSNSEQINLATKIIESFPQLIGEKDIIVKLRKAGLKDLLEFSRAIHAEMDAITTAARKGKPVRGSKMFVTTFPCHYCARHLVASGVHEVQYIEPYPKSLAMSLHKDAITANEIDWIPPDVIDEKYAQNDNYQKVLFRPFVGVAPRLYSRAFTKDRPLKNNQTGQLEIGSPVWGDKWAIQKISYVQLEAQLTKAKENE